MLTYLPIDAAIKVESLKEPGLINSFDQFMKDLKPGMNNAYYQIFETLPRSQRDLLVVALRWLICGRDNMPVECIGDEIELNWDEDTMDVQEDFPDYETNTLVSNLLDDLDLNQQDEPDSQESDHGVTADTLRRIGRDFVTVQNGLVALLHTSVRDFIESSDSPLRTISTFCTRCLRIQRDIDLELSAASQKNGHLLMAEHLLQKLNSHRFQKKYIVVEDFETTEEQSIRTSDQDTDVPRAESVESQSVEVKDSTENDTVWATEKQRYEIKEWPRHLREAECAWTAEDRKREAARWESLLDSAERFLDINSNVYKCWMRRTLPKVKERAFKEYEHPLHTAARHGLVSLMERYLGRGDCEVDPRNEVKVSYSL